MVKNIANCTTLIFVVCDDGQIIKKGPLSSIKEDLAIKVDSINLASSQGRKFIVLL